MCVRRLQQGELALHGSMLCLQIEVMVGRNIAGLEIAPLQDPLPFRTVIGLMRLHLPDAEVVLQD